MESMQAVKTGIGIIHCLLICRLPRFSKHERREVSYVRKRPTHLKKQTNIFKSSQKIVYIAEIDNSKLKRLTVFLILSLTALQIQPSVKTPQFYADKDRIVNDRPIFGKCILCIPTVFCI